MQISLAPVYYQQGDFVECIFAVYEAGNTITNNVQIGYVSLINKIRNPQYIKDVELARTEVKGEMVDDQGLIHIYFNHPLISDSLAVKADITMTDTSQLTQQVDINVLEKFIDDFLPKSDYSDVQNLNSYPYAPVENNVENDIVMDSDSANLFINFEAKNPLISGEGDFIYEGGGNRLLNDSNGKLIRQEPDILPSMINCSTLIEKGEGNLLSNNLFNASTEGVPDGFSVEYDEDLIKIYPETVTNKYLGDAVKEFLLRCVVINGLENHVDFRVTNDIAINQTKPLTVSFYLNFTFSSEVYATLEHSKIVIEAKNSSNVVLATFEESINASNYVDSYSLFSYTIPSFPANTAKISFKIQMGDLERGSDVTMGLIVPQIEQSLIISSRMAGLAPRQNDLYTIQQLGNLVLDFGTIAINYISSYSGNPKYEISLFDTRDLSGHNGFYACHKTNSDVQFVIDIGGSQTILSANKQVLEGNEILLAFTWNKFQNMRKILISVDGVESVLAEDITTPFNLPSNLNDIIYIGSNNSQDSFLNCKVKTFSISDNIYS